MQLVALYVPGDDPPGMGGSVVWTTSDDRIATVSAGLVRAVSPGKATIAARIGDLSATAALTVDTMALSPVRGGVFQRLSALPVADTRVTVRAHSLPGCSGAAVREVTTRTAADGSFATGIALPRFGAPGGDCVTVSVDPLPMPNAPPGRELLAGATVRLRWGSDVVPRVLSWSVLLALQPASAPPVMPGTRTWIAVSAGGSHTCALDSEGHAYCWGSNAYGQLGATAATRCLSPTLSATAPGTVSCSLEPVALQPAVPLRTLSASGSASCGLTAEGQLYCWGDGVASGATLVSAPAFAAFDGTCGLDARGAAYCWSGWGTPLRGSATLAGGVPPLTRISARGPSFCGVAADGKAWCWGSNFMAQAGNGRSGGLADPAPVLGSVLFRDVQLGGTSTCGLTPAGAAYCWGLDADGQLGSGRSAQEYCPANPAYIPRCSTVPIAVSTDQLFASVAVGGSHACALNPWGSVYCWGANASGQLGLTAGEATPHAVPEAIPGPLRFRTLSAGGSHTCGISLAGGLYCWGDNSYGQLGDGTLADHAQPALVVGSAP